MDLISTKVLVAVLFGVLRLVFGVLPLKLHQFLLCWEEQDHGATFVNKKRHDQVNCALAMCQSFGGGVLFATCFLHMVPEVYGSVEVLKNLGHISTDYPVSQLTICVGFFFVYFAEEFSHWFLTKVPDDMSRNGAAPKTTTPNRITPISISDEGPFIIPEETTTTTDKDDLDAVSLDDSTVQKENELNRERDDAEKIAEIEEVIEKEVKSQQKIVRGVLVVLALSLHAVFEGLAIGLQTSTANIWYLFTAVSIHSATILFCISLELIIAKTQIRIILIHVLALSITSPFGVLLGLLITIKSDMDTRAKSTAVVLLEGLSAGTILYITFFEVLNREKERRVFRFRRAICIISGFTLMGLLQYIETVRE